MDLILNIQTHMSEKYRVPHSYTYRHLIPSSEKMSYLTLSPSDHRSLAFRSREADKATAGAQGSEADVVERFVVLRGAWRAAAWARVFFKI